ncbi:MAG: tetratricopeptide repeat protein, partial [Bacteroidota bacterium]
MLDSLAHALEVQEEPQDRVHTLLALAEGWASADTAKAGNYLRQARDLVVAVDPAPARSAAWRKLGAIASNQGSYRQALHAFLKAQALDQEHGDDSLVIANLLSAGNVEMKLDHYDKALDHYLDALRMADRKPFRKSQSMALCNIGLVHANQSRFDEAIRYYRDALAIQE